MTSPRKILSAAVIVTLLGSVAVAEAAPRKRKPAPRKPVCSLITDPASDATGTGTPAPGQNEPSLDILSADIATNATTLTAVIRVSNLEASPDTAPTGRLWDVTFRTAGKEISLKSITGPGGNTWANGAGTGALYPKDKQVRFHIPLNKLSVPIRPNQVLTNLEARTGRWVAGTDVTLGVADVATSAKTYVATWPSCVKVGA